MTYLGKIPALPERSAWRPREIFANRPLAPERANFTASWTRGLLWPLAGIFLLGMAAQIYWGVNTDTSWNITLAEKVLDGERPYVDFIEINPPLSFFLYMPPTLIARLSGTTPEFMVDLFCFAGAALSLWLSGIILARGGGAGVDARLGLVAAAVLILLPARTFDEREHIALIACLPCLAGLAVLAAGGRVALFEGVLAGVGAGLAFSIKPYFVLFALPVLLDLTRRQGWRALVVRGELYAALATMALYWAAVAVFIPAFFEHAAPMVRDIYLPVRRPLTEFFSDPTILIWLSLAAVLTFAARRRLAEPFVATLTLSSVGAIAAYLVQGKLWPYQGYPAVALIALALGALLLGAPKPREGRSARRRVAVAAISTLLLTLAGFWFAVRADRPELERAVAAIAPHPKVLVIGSDIALGHPLTRHVRGQWVGSRFSLWITDMSSHALARGASGDEARRDEAYLQLDRERLVADIDDGKPDAILIANKLWLAWTKAHPDVAAALADYRWRETADGIMVYARNDLAR